MITKNLIASYDLTKGNLSDVSGNGHDLTMANELFFEGEKGHTGSYGPDNGSAVIAHSTDFDLDAFTVSLGGYFKDGIFPGAVFEYFASKGNFWVYTNGVNAIGIHAGTTFSTFTFTAEQLEDVSDIVITKASGSAMPKIYTKNGLVGTFPTAITIVNNTDIFALLSNQFVNGGYSGKLHAFSLYSDEKSADDVAEIIKYQSTLVTPRIGRRNFEVEPSIGPLASGSGWNMQTIDGVVEDKGPDGNDGDITPSVIGSKTVWGETALSFDGIGSYMSCGTASSLDFTSQTFGGWMWVKLKKIGTQILMSKGSTNVAGYELVSTGSGKVYFTTSQAGANQLITSSKALLEGVDTLVGFASVSGGKNYIYLDNIEDGSIDRIDPVAATGSPLYYGGIPSTAFPLDGDLAGVRIGEFASKEEFEKEMNKEWDRVKGLPLYNIDIEQTAISNTSITEVGAYVPYTDIQVDGGGLRIDEGDCAKQKSLSGGGFGSKGHTPHIGHPYGTYRCNVITTAVDRLYFSPINNGVDLITSANLTIDVTGGGVGQIQVAGNLLQSAIGYVSVGYHEFELEVTSEATNNCTLYMDGEKVPASVGSNPFTFNPVAANIKNYVFGPYGSSKICDFRHNK